MELNRRHVLVLGLGESGLAMARWCLREGARVRVADTREAPPMLAALRAFEASRGTTYSELRLGAFDASLLDDVDAIAISPGLSPSTEPQRALLATARERGIPVVGEIELFARALATLAHDEDYRPAVVAITGTNGKTTVTKLVGRFCEAAARSAAVAGNVSPAVLDVLATALDARAAAGTPLPSTWVLELSSFQLETTTSLVPTVATVLNVTQDHLDWHGTFDAYVQAKRRVFANGTVRVLNRDDARVTAMDAPVADRGRAARDVDVPVSVDFGLDAPVDAGSFGVVRDGRGPDALRWLAWADGTDGDAPRPARRGRRPGRPGHAGDESIALRRLMPVDALQVRGDHNVANALAALALGRAIGLPMAAMLRALGAYRGEPHRTQWVATVDGVDYVEDSKGTNVGASVAALQGLGRRVVLIAGGDGKGQDFSPLAAPVARHARAVVLVGRDRDAIRAALSATGVDLVDADTLDDAVDAAARVAEAGDCVLLSPACASLDMFRDYAHRAAVFVAAVERLAEREAVPC